MAEVIQKLCDLKGADFANTWAKFLFNVEFVRELGVPAECGALLHAGDQWRDESLTTGKASKLLYEATGVALVSATFTDYKSCYLDALALIGVWIFKRSP